MIFKKKILVMGLPGSGKSHLAEALAKGLNGVWINADKVREQYDDWDFTPEGRMRQAMRMKFLSDGANMAGQVAVADFICPTEKAREEFGADFTIWMDTIKEGRFEDTNLMFEEPSKCDYHITKWLTDINELLTTINNGKRMDRQKPTVQMLGRYQPWHAGHRELFKKAHAKTGQVIIMVRDTGEEYFDWSYLVEDLTEHNFTYGVDYEIMHVPNIVNITYGRDVGYKIEQEHLGEEIESISATDIRLAMAK
jgi:adenylylsulfate kinase